MRLPMRSRSPSGKSPCSHCPTTRTEYIQPLVTFDMAQWLNLDPWTAYRVVFVLSR